MKLRLLALFLCMLTAPLSAIAGLYGTLSGKVTDDKGKPVVGATVRVQGTTPELLLKQTANMSSSIFPPVHIPLYSKQSTTKTSKQRLAYLQTKPQN